MDELEKFKTYIPFEEITKADEEQRMVWGYASTPAMDLQGETVSLDAIKAALPAYMKWANIREMHTNSAVGITKEADVNKKGLYIGAKIVDEAAWQKCKEGVYKGFSIGGQKLKKVGSEIQNLNLLEISVVDRPANTECKIEVCKIADGGMAAVATEGEGLASMMEKWLDMGKGFMSMLKGGDGLSAPAKIVVDKAAEVTPVAAVPATTTGNAPVVYDDGFEKTAFSDDQRKELATSGAAMPDGSYPIRNKEDLGNAIQAFGRAKDKGKTKAHIKSRARALDAMDMLPEKWDTGSKQEKSAMTTDLLKRYAEAHKAAISKAAGALAKAEDEREKCMKAVDKCMDNVGKAAGGDLTEALTHIKKSLASMEDHHDVTSANIGKAASSYGSIDGQPNGTVTDDKREGLTVIPGANGTADSPGTGMFATGSPYSAAAMGDMMKTAIADALKPMQEQLQKSEIERARMEGEMSVLKSMPAAGARPRLFSMDGRTPVLPTDIAGSDTSAEVNTEIMKSYQTIDPNDPDSATRAASRIIGLRAGNPSIFGKSVTSPEFKGAAAGR